MTAWHPRLWSTGPSVNASKSETGPPWREHQTVQLVVPVHLAFAVGGIQRAGVTPADAPCAIPLPAGSRPPRYSAEWWTDWRDRAGPGSTAGPPRPPAGASRTSAAARAVWHAPAARTTAGSAAACAVPPRGRAARRAHRRTTGWPAAYGCSISQAATASRTAGSTGTMRSLPPLPMTRSIASMPGSGASRTSSASASAMRRPQP